MAGPILSIDTLTECPSVDIDRKLYQLTPADALDLVSIVKLQAFQAKYGDLARRLVQGDRSDAEILEAECAVEELVRLVLRAPAEVLDKLTTVQRLNVVSVFFELSPNGRHAATAQGSRPIGARSFPSSRGSTVAVRSNGSRGPRSPSSGRASK